jgi:hypothetical protein
MAKRVTLFSGNISLGTKQLQISFDGKCSNVVDSHVNERSLSIHVEVQKD